MPCDLFGALLMSSSEAAFDSTLIVRGGTGEILYMNKAATDFFDYASDEDKVNVNSLLNFSSSGNGEVNDSNRNSWQNELHINTPKTISASFDKIENSPFSTSVDMKVRCIKHAPCKCGCGTIYIIMSVQIVGTEGVSGENLHLQKVLQATVDASFDAMLSINCSGIMLMVNKAATELFGYTKGELIGHNISMICGKEHASNHDGYLKNYLKTGVTKIMGKKREVPARKKNGDEFPVELGIVEVSECDNERIFCAFVRDLTEQKKIEQELKLKESLTMGLINCSFDPMIQIDQKGIIRMVNDATCSLFCYKLDELIGSNVSILCGSEKSVDHGKNHQEYINRYLKSGQKRVIGSKRPTVARRKDGKQFDIELALSEVKNPVTGEIMFCGYIRDMTEINMHKKDKIRQEQMINSHFFDSTGDEPNTSEQRRPRRLRKSHTAD